MICVEMSSVEMFSEKLEEVEIGTEDGPACESGELLADWLVDIGLISLLLITSRILQVSLFAKP